MGRDTHSWNTYLLRANLCRLNRALEIRTDRHPRPRGAGLAGEADRKQGALILNLHEARATGLG